MNLMLNDDAQKLIHQQVTSGKYATPEDVVTAALHMLDQASRMDDFADGELDALLEEGEAGESLDGEAVFAELRRSAVA
jgi:Arc/MetJ-type ribon-helix-helix transcriptional regulator